MFREKRTGVLLFSALLAVALSFSFALPKAHAVTCFGDSCDKTGAGYTGCSNDNQTILDKKQIWDNSGRHTIGYLYLDYNGCEAAHATLQLTTSDTILESTIETDQSNYDAETIPCYGDGSGPPGGACSPHLIGPLWIDAGQAGLTSGQYSCFHAHSELEDLTTGDTHWNITNTGTFCYTG